MSFMSFMSFCPCISSLLFSSFPFSSLLSLLSLSLLSRPTFPRKAPPSYQTSNNASYLSICAQHTMSIRSSHQRRKHLRSQASPIQRPNNEADERTHNECTTQTRLRKE
ncbi:hypothetical protein EYC84_011410 [Monilinia fructicola]|uniref:Uncharacterized protein n=1 Tax=Monilinia fructicola TaxID=38448 RepID=A0A5M9J6S7_MONFR|nr:hypothetical protein EYC84_011410 [Monilinia fructicola]